MCSRIYVNNKQIHFLKRLRFKWFNIYYFPNESYLLDDYGEKFYYSLGEHPVRDIWFQHREVRVANIKLLWNDSVLELADFVVLPPFLKRKRDFRGRGLGTAMFSLVKQIAAENGIQVIWGKMRPEQPDLPEAWEQLRRFYYKQGCTFDGNIFRFEL